MKFLFLFITLFLSSLVISADEPRRNNIFTSPNQRYELKLKGAEWVLLDKTNKKELYRLRENLRSMTVLIGDDGKSITVVDDYSEQEWKENPEVLIFYNNGKKIRTYKLNEVLGKLHHVTVSASHFRWLLSEKPISVTDGKLRLTTTELNHYVFDAATGEILNKNKDEILSGDAVYVYGRVNRLGNGRYEIEVDCAVYGVVPENRKLQFTSEKQNLGGNGFYATLIIKNGKLADKKDHIILNVCRDKK
jgi:hypothetical protein